MNGPKYNSAPSQFARLRFEAGRLKSNDPTFRTIPSSGPAGFTTGPASIMYMVLAAAKFWKCVCCDSHRRNDDDDDVQRGSEFCRMLQLCQHLNLSEYRGFKLGPLAAVDDRLKRDHHRSW